VPTPAQCEEGIDADVVILTSGEQEEFFGGPCLMEARVRSGIRTGSHFCPLRFDGHHCWETPEMIARVREIIKTTFEL
jgi:hypothetical protein